MLSDISDDDLVKKLDRILMESQSNNIPDVVKTDEKGQRFAESTCISDVERESISKWRFARKAESKSRRTVNLFNQWLRNREITDTGKTYSKNPRGFADHENLNYSLCAFITEFRKENCEEYLDNTLYDIILALKLTSWEWKICDPDGWYWIWRNAENVI